MSLKDDVNDFMEEYYEERLDVPLVYAPKVIHMARLGTNHFSMHEIATIDLPIVQRLKYISQLGTVYNVFPTARHTRFEHSLGVAILVKNMWASLLENGSLRNNKYENQKKLNNLRMAALLHDIGHGPFSHVTENTIMNYESIEEATLDLKAKPHEVLSYYMIKSNVFRTFLEDLSKKYKVEGLNANDIAGYIIGEAEKPEENQYLADLINGPIDADKLDYIIRDSDYSGVPLAVGIDRLLLSLEVGEIETEDGKRKKLGRYKKLVVNEKGITPFEQLIFAKIMLYSSVYHHQKVRALDSMITSIMRIITEENIPINGEEISSPCDFLRLDDADILNLSKSKLDTPSSNKFKPKINELCKQLRLRHTFKRSLVISPKTIGSIRIEPSEKEDGDPVEVTYRNKFSSILKYSESAKKMRRLNQMLAVIIDDSKCTEFDVAFDLPLTTSLGVSSEKIIKSGPEEFKAMKDIFPEKGWLDSYMANKWEGHLFANQKFREEARFAGKMLLEDLFGIKLNKHAEIQAKILDPIDPQKRLIDYIKET